MLLGKFAQLEKTGRTVSVNGLASGNTGYARIKQLKLGWQEGIDSEFRDRFGLTRLEPQGDKAAQP